MIKIGVRLKNVVRPYNMETMLDWMEWCKEADFEVVDVPYLTEEAKQMADKTGLQVGSFDIDDVRTLFSKDEDTRKKSVDSVITQLEGAAAQGGSICFMCLVPEDTSQSREQSFQFFKETFPAITAKAEALGIKIVLEGFPGPEPTLPTLGCTPETLRAMFEAVPSPSLTVNYDPSHLVRLGVDYMRFLREFSDRIGHVHGKDCKILEEDVYLYGRHQAAAFGQPVKFSQGPWRYTIPGEGDVNWAEVAFELERLGYDGAICIELEDHRYSEDPEKRRLGLKKALKNLKQYF